MELISWVGHYYSTDPEIVYYQWPYSKIIDCFEGWNSREGKKARLQEKAAKESKWRKI